MFKPLNEAMMWASKRCHMGGDLGKALQYKGVALLVRSPLPLIRSLCKVFKDAGPRNCDRASEGI